MLAQEYEIDSFPNEIIIKLIHQKISHQLAYYQN